MAARRTRKYGVPHVLPTRKAGCSAILNEGHSEGIQEDLANKPGRSKHDRHNSTPTPSPQTRVVSRIAGSGDVGNDHFPGASFRRESAHSPGRYGGTDPCGE